MRPSCPCRSSRMRSSHTTARAAAVGSPSRPSISSSLRGPARRSSTHGIGSAKPPIRTSGGRARAARTSSIKASRFGRVRSHRSSSRRPAWKRAWHPVGSEIPTASSSSMDFIGRWLGWTWMGDRWSRHSSRSRAAIAGERFAATLVVVRNSNARPASRTDLSIGSPHEEEEREQERGQGEARLRRGA